MLNYNTKGKVKVVPQKIGFFIAHFNASSSTKELQALIEKLKPFQHQIIIIQNHESFRDRAHIRHENNIYTIHRENTGMNIGAWRQGYELFNNFDYYFFFQSECFIKNDDFITKYINLFRENRNLGMIGDSINFNWDQSWENLKKSSLNQMISIQEHNYTEKDIIDGNPILHTSRVEYYQKKLEDWGIATGKNSAVHLRALNWCFEKNALDAVKFPIGYSKHECIAAEIAVTRSVIHSGFGIAQSHKEPFTYVGHPEWRGNGKAVNQT